MSEKAIHHNVRVWRNRIEFLERHLPTFGRVSNTDDNYGEYRLMMFTILTQHVHANSVTELIDKGLAIEEKEEDKQIKKGADSSSLSFNKEGL